MSVQLWFITDFSQYSSLNDAFFHISSMVEAGVYAVTLRHLGILSPAEEITLHTRLQSHYPHTPIFLHGERAPLDAHIHFRSGQTTNFRQYKHSAPERLIARSTHSLPEAVSMLKKGADMVTLSPIFTPFSKPDDRRNTIEPVAIEGVWLLGGITEKRALSLIAKGYPRLAGISLFYQENATQSITRLLRYRRSD